MSIVSAILTVMLFSVPVPLTFFFGAVQLLLSYRAKLLKEVPTPVSPLFITVSAPAVFDMRAGVGRKPTTVLIADYTTALASQ